MKFIDAKIIGADVPTAVYLAEPCSRGEAGFTMSRSELMRFMDNPHKWLPGTPHDRTESTDWGSLIDCLVLTPHRFDEVYVVAPEKYPSEGMKCPGCGSVTSAKTCRKCGCDRVKVTVEKPWDWNATYCDEWRQRQDGKQAIKHVNHLEAMRAVTLVYESAEAAEILKCSERQVMVTATYQDADTGISVPVKCLLDFVPNKGHLRRGKSLGDFKTAQSCKPYRWECEIYDRNYDAQAALCQDLYVAATGEDRPDWIHIVQENDPPYEMANPLPLLSTQFLDIGRAKYRFALKFYCRCLATGKWPSYSIGQRVEVEGCYIAEPSEKMILNMADWPKLTELKKAPAAPEEEMFYARH